MQRILYSLFSVGINEVVFLKQHIITRKSISDYFFYLFNAGYSYRCYHLCWFFSQNHKDSKTRKCQSAEYIQHGIVFIARRRRW